MMTQSGPLKNGADTEVLYRREMTDGLDRRGIEYATDIELLQSLPPFPRNSHLTAVVLERDDS